MAAAKLRLRTSAVGFGDSLLLEVVNLGFSHEKASCNSGFCPLSVSGYLTYSLFISSFVFKLLHILKLCFVLI